MKKTEWFPASVNPCADRPGYYQVRYATDREDADEDSLRKLYWDGESWVFREGDHEPTLWGRPYDSEFSKEFWRGLAQEAA